MEQLLAAAAEVMSTPPEMVERSARARAQADGSSVEAVLEAWAGGTAAPQPATPSQAPPSADPQAPAPAPESLPATVDEPATEESVDAQPASDVMTVPVAATVEEPPDDVEIPSLRERIRLPMLAGALIGGISGVVIVMTSLSQMIGQAAVVGEPSRAAIEVTAVRYFVVVAAVSAIVGALVGLAAHGLPALFDRGAELRSTPLGAAGLGVVAGTALGILGAATLLFVAGEPFEQLVGEETVRTTLIPVRAGLFFLTFGGAALGALTAAAVQLTSIPAHLDAAAAADSDEHKNRLINALMIPMTAAVIIAVIVLPFAYLMIQFPSFAPVTAGVVASAILAIAALMGSRPNARITRGEVAVAAAGIGVLVLIVALLASAWDSGDHGEDEHTDEEAIEQVISG